MMQREITVHTTVRYEAAHWLPGVPEGHQCGRMHGHSYVLTIGIAGAVGPVSGFVRDLDFAEVKAACAAPLALLDHHVVNDVIDNPTVEMQLHWWADQLLSAGLEVSTLRLQETANNFATLVITR